MEAAVESMISFFFILSSKPIKIPSSHISFHLLMEAIGIRARHIFDIVQAAYWLAVLDGQADIVVAVRVLALHHALLR